MPPVRRLVLDVLKPHEPELPTFAQALTDVDGVEALSTSLVEIDREVQNVKVIAQGEDLDVDRIERAVEREGGTIHSVDEVACGAYLIDDRPPLQEG